MTPPHRDDPLTRHAALDDAPALCATWSPHGVMITHTDLIAFVYREARLLDEQRFDEWLALFAPDARYWIPLEQDPADRNPSIALLDEDLFLLRLRTERLKGGPTPSRKPKIRCHHLLQRPQVDLFDPAANRYGLWTPMHYVEARMDQQTHYPAWATHTLTVIDGALRIQAKRVDLVHCNPAPGAIQLFP